MAEGRPVAQDRRDIVPRRGLVRRRVQAQLAKLIRYRHYEHKRNPDWTSYASQRHVRDIAVDYPRKQLWLATWGGVLCIAANSGTRHTSEHGLIGNATRCVVVDGEGVVWAAGQYGGLCSLTPEENSPWQVHVELRSWTVLRMVANPNGGVYVALRNREGQCAIHSVKRTKAKKPKPATGDVAVRDIQAMLVDRLGVLWLGNVWGLHRHNHGKSKTIELDRMQISSLATSVGGSLWAGTNRGLYRLNPETGSCDQHEGWPRDQVVSLAEESVSGHLWVATEREVGRIINNTWQPVRHSPSDRSNVLRVANAETDPQETSGRSHFRSGHAWVGGANGLYHVGPDESESVLTSHPEDELSNAVQCLWAEGQMVCMGTARGLSCYNGKGWVNGSADGSLLRDVRTLAVHQNNGRLWVGTWTKGLHSLEAGVCSTDHSLTLPLVSLSAGADGSLWAAGIDAVYCKRVQNQPWSQIPHPPQALLDGRLIQVICYQLAINGAEQTPTLWIGTSRGLLRYQPDDIAPWDCQKPELKTLSIQAMALDPITNQLWVGTSNGLFSEHEWKAHRITNVRSLAFGPAPECDLFLGTSEQLERWAAPGTGGVFAAPPAATFSSFADGLAADQVTALAVRVTDNNQREVWIGSSAGVSSFRYSP